MARLVKLPKQKELQLAEKEGEDFLTLLKRRDIVVDQWEKNGEKLLYIPYADGYAVYLVIKESPLTLAHVPVGDCWHLPAAFIRGLKSSDLKGGYIMGLPID